jgi:hypothetical protein
MKMDRKESKKLWAKEHPEEVRAAYKRYYNKNKKLIRAKSKEYRIKNRERVDRQHREYCAKNKDRINAYQREYFKAHPEYVERKIKKCCINKREEEVKRLLVGEFKKFRVPVTKLITTDACLKIQPGRISGLVFGALVYILMTKQGFSRGDVVHMLPDSARSTGRRPFISCFKYCKIIKKTIENENKRVGYA